MMKLITQTPKRTLNKAFLKQRPLRSQMDLFKTELISLLGCIDQNETEEFHKNLVSSFLKKAIYHEKNFINTKGRQDLVIHNGKDNKTNVGVIIEAKRPTNKGDWFTPDKPNGKALHELVLYYLRERIEANNIDIKYLVATNINEWYIIEAKYFENIFYKNKAFVKQYEEWRDGKKVTKDTSLFYNEIAKPFIGQLEDEIPCAYFNIQRYAKALKNEDKEDDKNLIALLKILSPQHLLKVPFANDSNELDDKFYKELLHIIGLEEAKERGRNIIRRKVVNRNAASLLEMAFKKLLTKGIHKIPDIKAFGETSDEHHFNIALELCITWINRILFLKLLEGQLVSYHNIPSSRGHERKGEAYRFLNTETIQDFDELFKLFHNVLAVGIANREEGIQQKYKLVPYLNSSLFEISELEDVTICIDSMDNSETLEFNNTSILKEQKTKNQKLKTLDYLFQFLDAYDFASEGAENIQEDNKPLINASVLGKVFEKINGYKDGSIYTPGFITMYMCRQSIRQAVVQKFNDQKNWNIKTFDELYNKIEDINEANNIINDLKLCDPAVGSGHFLVSALNEIIAIKSELKILQDKNGKRLKEYTVEVENDELYVTDEDGEIFEYKAPATLERVGGEVQRVQETLFLEKQRIIENCLFGVDINPNSVKICRLRLWIELLKNAYYKTSSLLEKAGHEVLQELETLPNIDINIKCGNSLLSRFNLKDDVFERVPNFKKKLNDYKFWVTEYKNAKDRNFKKQLTENIRLFTDEFKKRDPKIVKLQSDLDKKSKEFFEKFVTQKLFSEIANPKVLKEKERLEIEIEKLATTIKQLHSDNSFRNAFEWRFEFPEVLNNNGEFEGFDVLIGNPPYIRQEEITHQKNYLQNNYETYSGTADLYVFFVEKGFEILNQRGHFCYIMPNKWMQAGYGKALRSFLLNKQILSVIDFGDLQVFNRVTTYPCILNAAKEKSNNTFKSVVVKSLKFEKGFEDYVMLNNNAMKMSDLSNENWVISSSSEQILLSKIKPLTISLSKYIKGNSYRGILTGLSEAFIINKETRERLIGEDKNSERLIKPFLLGRNIQPYANSNATSWLILIPKGFTIKRNLPPGDNFYLSEPPPRYGNMPYDDAWEWINEAYPAIAKHLLPFKNKAEKRTDKGDYWWELRACDYYQEFEAPKIMYQKFQVKPCFIFDESGVYCNDSMWIIPKDDKFLLGILNSKVGWWLISKYCTAIQNGYQLIWKYFGQIPIPNVLNSQKTSIEKYVNQILSSKKQNQNIDTTELEKQMDGLIYQLYDLTLEEIKIIEAK